MEPQSIDALVNFLLGQDPWFLLITFLLVRGEVRTNETLKALSLLNQLRESNPSDSKATLRQ